MLKIMGLGPGAYEALTIGALKELKNNKNIYFRTEKHPTVDFLKEEGIKFESYDHAYEMYDSFDDVYKYIAEDVITKVKEDEDLIYAVPGHPLVAERSVINLIDLCEEKEIAYEILPAVSFVDAMMEALQVDPVEGLKIVDAFDMKNQILDKRVGTIITQVYNNFIASEVKLRLLEGYKEDTEIIFVRAAGVEGLESIRKIKLYELDWQEDIDYLTSIYIPKDLDNKKDFQDLLDIIELLRSPEGCPWDGEQTHESLKSALLEECYEVIDAIENEDEDALIEELGDVLLQVVFHASIGKEDGYFDIMDVIDAISGKMINRHPHVFSNSEVENSEDVVANWDEIKKKEKSIETLTDEMEAIAKSLPATTRAYKVQKKAKKVGFDWDDVNCAMDKVREELEEIKEVYNSEDKSIIEGEVGDLLFACINVARFLEVDGELALDKTIKKFIKRFSYIENEANKKNKNLNDMTLDEMDKLWDKAKESEK
ncbi:nucleoside triphosphate pyrophosphohydrolase [Clostridium sp. B9]|uniref:nucleoside triphosphate pyrophosphohydrolase n=1 Tax=Clostridium sp. B9 TaxID=3423224 RepID=UPI003D2EF652